MFWGGETDFMTPPPPPPQAIAMKSDSTNVIQKWDKNRFTFMQDTEYMTVILNSIAYYVYNATLIQDDI